MIQPKMRVIPLRTVSLHSIRKQLTMRANYKRVSDGSGHGGEGFSAGWIQGLSNTRLFLRRPGTSTPDGVQIDVLAQFPAIEMAIEELREEVGHRILTQVMVNVLDAGGKLSAHRDGLPDDARYHLPVNTNDRAVWWDEFNGTMHMTEGHWHGPVPYYGVLHAVANNGTESRLHVVADFQKHP